MACTVHGGPLQPRGAALGRSLLVFFVATRFILCPRMPTQITAGLLRHAARGGGAASDAEIKADVARSLAWLEAATKPLPPV